MNGHFMTLGSCGHVIDQCRCPSPNKYVKTEDHPCHKCAEKEADERD